MRRPISSINPLFYSISVFLRRSFRHLKWVFGGQKFARTLSDQRLQFSVLKHQSVLIRKLGDTDASLQINKIENLKIAIQNLNGVIIRPRETFSYWRLVGLATKSKGYLEGVMLSSGEPKAGIGGGLCQLANLIHWLIIHSPLTVTERQHHSINYFPDDRRVVPFGVGATVFYNYLDYQFRNDTPYIFQLLFWLDEKCLNGDLHADSQLPYKYRVFEKNHRFVRARDDNYYRVNEIWRVKRGRKDSEPELLQKNRALVKYVPAEFVEE